MKKDSVSAYVHMRRNIPLFLYAQVHILDEPPSFPQLRKYIMDGLHLNQKTNTNIRISYSMKYLNSKIKIFAKKQMVL